MIHHISIGAENPERVAKVLAEVVGGRALPFPVFPNSYIVIIGDRYGTAIEVLPIDYELVPGETEVTFQANDRASRHTTTHAAISVPLSRSEIEKIGAREGWEVRYCSREGVFDVIEFWVENRLMLEFLSPEMESRYLSFVTIENAEKMFSLAPS